MSQLQEIHTIVKWLHNSTYTVAFTGAGISTASGLPDYRGPNGLWTLREKGITPKRLDKYWYEYEPNPGHLALSKMLDLDIIKFIISQNVDGLHLKSGVPQSKIAELHGNATIMQCRYCDSRYHLDDLGWDRRVHGRGGKNDLPQLNQPVCFNCGSRVVSSVIDFGDSLPQEAFNKARSESLRADLIFVLGSSLSVFPAASIPRIAKNNGAKLIIINQGETELDEIADMKIDDDVSVLLPKILDSYQK